MEKKEVKRVVKNTKSKSKDKTDLLIEWVKAFHEAEGHRGDTLKRAESMKKMNDILKQL
jgi:hypothetical protein